MPRLIVEDGSAAASSPTTWSAAASRSSAPTPSSWPRAAQGRTYSNTTNAIISTGCGAALAYHTGVPLKDMEFVQFHPTGLYTSTSS